MNDSEPDMFYSGLHARMDEEADADKTYSESVNEDESEEEEEANRLGQELEAQGTTTLKRKKVGRKSCWPEEFVEEIVNIICENEYYRKKLIFTNCKATQALWQNSKQG